MVVSSLHSLSSGLSLIAAVPMVNSVLSSLTFDG